MSQILSHRPAGRKFDYAAAIGFAAQARGVRPLRIGFEMLRLSWGPGRLMPEEYFLHGAWCPGLGWDERRAFLGSAVTVALNTSLNPPSDDSGTLSIVNKLASHARFAEAGLAQPRTLAVAGVNAPEDGVRWLNSPDATLDFLSEPGNLPCFGKPVNGSRGRGAASLMERDCAGHLTLGNGQKVAAAALVAEIWQDYPSGFMFQELVRPHPVLAALIGPVIGSLRVTTINAGSGPEVLYAVQKAPAAGAMVDSLQGPIGSMAAVDLTDGRLLRAQDRRRLGGVDLAENVVTGVPFAGAELPDFAQALRLACQAHGCFPDHGILGADIVLSDRGPLVNEVNSNPDHSAYQISHARGLLNADFLPRLEAVRAKFRTISPKSRLAPLR